MVMETVSETQDTNTTLTRLITQENVQTYIFSLLTMEVLQ
jgi:hypothetical protein